MLAYVDACALIAYANGHADVLALFRRFVKSGGQFVTTNLLELETVPFAKRSGRREESQALEAFFRRWSPRRASAKVVELAVSESSVHPLGPMDALHLSAASLLGASWFFTVEAKTKPMYRTRLISVVHASDAIRKLRL